MRRTINPAHSIGCLSAALLLLAATASPGRSQRPTGGKAPAATGAAARGERPRFALLVGINEYQSKGISRLRGAVNDVAAVKELLVNRYGFPDDVEHIRVLTDANATRENILGLFESFLIGNAEKHRHANPIIFFHYSGHGSRAEDFDDEEPDAKDETIVPTDSGVNGKSDIADDEIEELVSRLAGLTDNALYVFDSCYSGTVNRGDNPAREAPEDKARYPERKGGTKPAPARRKAGGERIGFLPPSDRYVVISGSRSNQKAYEKPLPGNQYQGAMTYYLLQELRRATPETSYLELMTRVSAEVRRENENQAPQVQGDITRTVLGGAASRKDYFIKIGKVENKRISIEAGASLGVRPGSLVAVYKSGTQRLAGKEGRVALAEVKSVGATTSVAEVTESSPGAVLSVNDQAVLLTPFYGFEPMSVVLEADAAPGGERAREALGQVAALLGSSPLVKVTQVPTGDSACQVGATDAGTSRLSADVYVRRGPFGCVFPSPPLSKQKAPDGSEIPQPAAGENVFYLAAKGGEPVYEFWIRADHPDAPRVISDALLKLARQRNLLALENRASPVNGSVEVTVLRVTIRMEEGVSEVETETPVTISRGVGGDIYYPFKIGEHFRFLILNKSDSGADVYITALNISNDGAINMMYPPGGGEPEPLKAGRAVKTSVFRATPPLGEENFKIIVTTNPANFGPLIQGRVTSRDGENNTLLALMQQALTGTRGSLGIVTKGMDDWGTVSISFVVQKN